LWQIDIFFQMRVFETWPISLIVSLFIFLRSYIYDFIIVKMTSRWYKQVLTLLPENSTVLDVGIGTGRALLNNADLLRRKNIKVFGTLFGDKFALVFVSMSFDQFGCFRYRLRLGLRQRLSFVDRRDKDGRPRRRQMRLCIRIFRRPTIRCYIF
jgi:hypothetical protein